VPEEAILLPEQWELPDAEGRDTVAKIEIVGGAFSGEVRTVLGEGIVIGLGRRHLIGCTGNRFCPGVRGLKLDPKAVVVTFFHFTRQMRVTGWSSRLYFTRSRPSAPPPALGGQLRPSLRTDAHQWR
jgi:hypothetical protein